VSIYVCQALALALEAATISIHNTNLNLMNKKIDINGSLFIQFFHQCILITDAIQTFFDENINKIESLSSAINNTEQNSTSKLIIDQFIKLSYNKQFFALLYVNMTCLYSFQQISPTFYNEYGPLKKYDFINKYNVLIVSMHPAIVELMKLIK
jgi:hypothetical protein